MHWGALEILVFTIYLAAIILIVFIVSRKNARDIRNKIPDEIDSAVKKEPTNIKEPEEKDYEF